jgi:predicted nucleic acid-binding protein
MKLLIDTNVLLDFYRTQQNKLGALDDLVRLGTQVFFPEQIMREFRRNRSERIDGCLSSGAPPSKPVTPGFLEDAPEAQAVVEAHRHYQAAFEALERTVADRKAKPASDPVSVKVEALYAAAERIPTTDEIVAKAERRMLRGDPPMSAGRRSVCDEIIWESVLACADDDLVLVSRDGTFAKHEAFLAEEFKARTGKNLLVVDRISTAQKKLERPAAEERRAEEAEKAWDPQYQRQIMFRMNHGPKVSFHRDPEHMKAGIAFRVNFNGRFYNPDELLDLFDKVVSDAASKDDEFAFWSLLSPARNLRQATWDLTQKAECRWSKEDWLRVAERFAELEQAHDESVIRSWDDTGEVGIFDRDGTFLGMATYIPPGRPNGATDPTAGLLMGAPTAVREGGRYAMEIRGRRIRFVAGPTAGGGAFVIHFR